jgi:hypothetical protein
MTESQQVGRITDARAGSGVALSQLMLLVLGILFVVGWLLLKLVWNVAAFGVHFLLVAALIAVIVHFVRARGTSP